MKKLLILTAVGTILTMPAMAVQKCAPAWGYSGAFPMNYAGGGTTGKTNFSIVYSPSSPDSFTMDGIAHCSSQAPTTSTTGRMTSDLNMAAGKYCWCRIVSPALSNWIPMESTEITSTDTCASNCAYQCGLSLATGNAKTTYGQAMVSYTWGDL